jgi:hypothetical protein
VTNENGCQSEPSNIIHFIFTAIPESGEWANIILYPNPVHDNVYIRFNHPPEKNIIIKISDITGKHIAEHHVDNIDLQDVININTSALKKCLYLLTVIDNEGNILFTRKIEKQ